MTPLPPVSSVLRLALEWTDNASISAGCRLFFSYSGGPPAAADLTSLCTDVEGYYKTYLAGSAASTQILTSITATDLQTSSGNVGVAEVSVPGTNANGQLPAGMATCMNHKIARRYRGGKPKTFLPLGTVADVANGNTWTDAYQTAFATSFLEFVGDVLTFTSASFQPTNHVNVSYYAGFTAVLNPVTGRYRNVPKLRATPVIDTITTSVVAPKFGSQRRRLNT